MRTRLILSMPILWLTLQALPALAGDPPGKSPAEVPLEQLDRECQAAREKRLAPLREAEIGKCEAERGNDPGYCKRFYADYGNGQRSPNGTYRPPMFNDIPECVKADDERQRRARGTGR